ncbi:aminopeptidase [Escherichia coli]|nr:aminopeptidase [Escherichia coli]
MMEILRGSPALSAFRINKLLARFQAARLPVHTIYAEYVHFADLNAPLNDDEHAQLERLLKYGPALASHAPQGKLLLVTPRPGTISPWSSKATDIAHNCGLQQLCEASAVSGDEQEVRDILINTLEPCVNEITFDGLGSFVARKGNKGPKVAVVGHMDEVGFMVTHIDESGFLRFTTIGGWWNQSMLNHRVTIRTHKGVKIPGVIGSVAPHALTEKQKQQPLSFDEMFIDIGANSREEVEKRGVEIGNFISPEANFACWGEDKVVGKALDNRIGCAMMAELLQTVNNPEITLYGVGSVEEEVGLRGAQTSAEHIKPDVVIVLDTAVAGDVPGIDNIKYPLKLGQGPGLMLFDKRYFPNQKLVAALKNCAAHNDLPLQFSTMKTGATDGGRYNVMGGGRPVVALCLPTRYLHANSGMISKADYDALLTLIRGFLTTLTAEKVNAFSQFRQVD